MVLCILDRLSPDAIHGCCRQLIRGSGKQLVKMAMGDAPHKSGRGHRHRAPGASRHSSVQTSAKSKADSRSVEERLERLDTEQDWVGERNNTPGRNIVRGTAGQLLSLAATVRHVPSIWQSHSRLVSSEAACAKAVLGRCTCNEAWACHCRVSSNGSRSKLHWPHWGGSYTMMWGASLCMPLG